MKAGLNSPAFFIPSNCIGIDTVSIMNTESRATTRLFFLPIIFYIWNSVRDNAHLQANFNFKFQTMSLVNTLMQPLREIYSGRFDKNESRPSRYGAFDFMAQDGRKPNSIFSQDLRDKIRMSFDRTVQVPVIDAEDVTISNVRSCTIADDESTSQLVNLTFITYAFGFTMYPSQYMNNEIGYQADFNRKLNNRLIRFAAALDSQSIATLEASRNQVWTDIDQYPNVGNALRVTQAQKNDYYNKLQSIKETMDFYDSPYVVASTSASPLVRRLDNQGSNNGTNESFQLMPYTWLFTNRIPNGAGVAETHYTVSEGSTAIETRIDPDSEAGNMVGDYLQWAAVNVPLPNSSETIRMGSLFREDCADASGLQSPNTGVAGKTATLRQSFSWSVDMTFATAYNSSPSTRYAPILKTEILT